MPLIAGARLGAYEILALLGSGGMGDVYRAIDTRLGRQIALNALRRGRGRVDVHSGDERWA